MITNASTYLRAPPGTEVRNDHVSTTANADLRFEVVWPAALVGVGVLVVLGALLRRN